MIYPSSRSPRTLLQGILIASLALLIAACGSSSKTSPDTTPEPFTFTAVSGVEPGAWQSSERVTVSGINVATPVSVSGGQYAIGSGAFTAAAGQITNGQELRVRIQAPEQASAEGVMTVTVGTYSTTFEVFTFDDETPPTATIAFPPPFSATDRETLTVRGTAQDDYSAVAGVTLKITNGESVTEVEAESDDGFATWTAEVTLAAGEVHTFTVEAIDTADNQNTNAAEAVVHQQAFGLAFPDDEVPIGFARGLVFDKSGNRVLISNLDESQMELFPSAIIAVDMETGQRSVLSSPTVPDEENSIYIIRGIALDASRNRLLATSYLDASIYTIDLETGVRKILSSPTVPDSDQPTMPNPVAITVDPNNVNVAYVLANGFGTEKKLIRINMETGERFVITDNTMEDTGPYFGTPNDLLVDSANNRVFVNSSYQTTLYSVDIDTGMRSIISSMEHPESNSDACTIMSITTHYQTDKLLGWCHYLPALVELDINTGERTSIPFRLTYREVEPGYLHHVEEHGYVLRMDERTMGLYAIDLKTFQYVTISKSATE